MIRVDDIQHVSLVVTDLARARAFYGHALGLDEIERPDFDFPGAWYRVGGRQLHLIVHDGARTLRGTRAIDSRDGHVALRVRDLGAAVAWLREQGVEVLEKRASRTPWAQAFVADPDGNVIELNDTEAT